MRSARARTRVVLLVPGGPKRIADLACTFPIGWLSGFNLSLLSFIRTGLMNIVQSLSETGVSLAPQVSPRSTMSEAALSGVLRVLGVLRLAKASSRHQIPTRSLSACAYEKTLAVAQLSGSVTFVLWPEHHPISFPPGFWDSGIFVESAYCHRFIKFWA